jgi:hypothetical protein
VQPTKGTYRLNVDSTRAASIRAVHSRHRRLDLHRSGRRRPPPGDPDDPALDATGTAPAGQAFTIPITADATAVTVQVSYDDGTTWHRVPVNSHGLEALSTPRSGTRHRRLRVDEVRATGRHRHPHTRPSAHAYRIGS